MNSEAAVWRERDTSGVGRREPDLLV